MFKFKFKGDGRMSQEPLVIIRGEQISLYYMDNKEYRSDTEYTVTIPLYYVSIIEMRFVKNSSNRLLKTYIYI